MINPRPLHQAMAIALLCGAAALASAQTGTSGGNASTAPSGSAAGSSDTGSSHAAHPAMHHAHAKSASHAHMRHESETPYQAALKRCVEGPAGQRDNCIDQAINQYGQS